MMSTRLRLKRAAYTGICAVLAGALQGDAQAADSIVPSAWNVAPMTNGAYREAFDAVLPSWAVAGANGVTNSFTPAITGLPVRSNAWFEANVKVLRLDTEGAVVTNTLAYPGVEGPVVFSNKSVYVDLRVKFDAMTDSPDLSLLDNVKMAVFVSSDAKLVAVHAGGASTNASVLDTNTWYQVTVVLSNSTFDVLMNDAVVFSDLSLKAGGDTNTLASVSFYGTGLIDELYVSHGDPAYAIAGPTVAMPTLPAPGSNPPSDQEQTLINVWLSGYPGITPSTSLAALTQDQLSIAYLLNALGGDSSNAAPVEYTFGISNIDMTSPTSLIVTLALETNGADKDGTINGKIQLQGKVDINDAWTTLAGSITPLYGDFTDGKATYTFTIPSGGYLFFQPQIVP